MRADGMNWRWRIAIYGPAAVVLLGLLVAVGLKMADMRALDQARAKFTADYARTPQ